MTNLTRTKENLVTLDTPKVSLVDANDQSCIRTDEQEKVCLEVSKTSVHTSGTNLQTFCTILAVIVTMF